MSCVHSAGAGGTGEDSPCPGNEGVSRHAGLPWGWPGRGPGGPAPGAVSWAGCSWRREGRNPPCTHLGCSACPQAARLWKAQALKAPEPQVVAWAR